MERETRREKAAPEQEIEREINGDEVGPGAEGEVGTGTEREAGASSGISSWFSSGSSSSITSWHFFAYFPKGLCFYFSLLSRLTIVFG